MSKKNGIETKSVNQFELQPQDNQSPMTAMIQSSSIVTQSPMKLKNKKKAKQNLMMTIPGSNVNQR